MISVYLQGGLGNQLFQIFTCIAYALENNIEFKFPLYNQNNKNPTSPPSILYPNGHPRPPYWENFLNALKSYTVVNSELYKNLQNCQYREPHYHYCDIPKINNGLLIGYFQSDKYFKKYYSEILNLIKFNDYKNVIKQKYKHLFLKDKSTYVSMQFRIGDSKRPNCGLNGAHIVIPIEFPEFNSDALKHIINMSKNKHYTILYFCEEEDKEFVVNQINNYKKIFKNCSFIRPIGEDWEEIIIMSLCEHNIINNSTFGWWGAYFNNNKKKIVCYPEAWWGKTNLCNNLKDLFPEEWCKIHCKDYWKKIHQL